MFTVVVLVLEAAEATSVAEAEQVLMVGGVTVEALEAVVRHLFLETLHQKLSAVIQQPTISYI